VPADPAAALTVRRINRVRLELVELVGGLDERGRELVGLPGAELHVLRGHVDRPLNRGVGVLNPADVHVGPVGPLWRVGEPDHPFGAFEPPRPTARTVVLPMTHPSRALGCRVVPELLGVDLVASGVILGVVEEHVSALRAAVEARRILFLEVGDLRDLGLGELVGVVPPRRSGVRAGVHRDSISVRATPCLARTLHGVVSVLFSASG